MTPLYILIPAIILVLVVNFLSFPPAKANLPAPYEEYPQYLLARNRIGKSAPEKKKEVLLSEETIKNIRDSLTACQMSGACKGRSK